MYQYAAHCLGRHTGAKGSFRFGHKVRSECLTSTFRASCCSANWSQAQVPTVTSSSVRNRKKKGEQPALVDTREERTSLTDIGSSRTVWSQMKRFVISAAMVIPHKINMCVNGRKEGNVLFNDALNRFYLQLYGVGHMVKDHSDSERGNPLPPHGLLFPIRARVLLYAPSHRQDNTYHSLCYTNSGAMAGTRNSSMGPPHEGSIRRPIAP